MDTVLLKKKMEQFCLPGLITEIKTFGNGHINDTYLCTMEVDGAINSRIIFQRMNSEVFKNPEQVMDNVWHVTDFLQQKVVAAGGDPRRETMNVLLTVEGKPYYRDDTGDYWRCYRFIEDATSYETVRKPEDFYACAYAFDNFQWM
ncbi:MAG: mucin desulfatase, partial [Lachnospiraceae bacterium]|nr:mucin desulfatase [Lachnospiraceae bacterium]